MRIPAMLPRLTFAGVVAVAILSAATIARSQQNSQQNPYRLKEQDQKKLCLACHSEFAEKLKNKFVHTPVRSGDCSGCHDPHVSSHGKLLATESRDMCTRCHEGVIPDKAKSVHQVVADGECQKCHDPHGSANPANLVAKGDDLCFTCHKQMGEAVKKAKFKHTPVEQGCLTCHSAHGSAGATHLLKADVPGVCVNCHQPGTASFQARHNKYPVAKASCTSCHDPHGSATPALLQNSVHAPLTNGTCNQCHENADSPKPFATKQAGFELCKGCHSELVNTTLAKRRLHWPVADKTGCVNCHNPHAAKQGKLLKASAGQLCGSCHAETVKRIAAIPVKHAPVSDGSCVACHSPHAADGVMLIDRPTVNELCTTCHDYQTHSAHPIGEKAIDPRNKNLRVNCLSCHKGHGTEYKWMLLAPTNVELCTQCHKKYSR